MGESGKRASGLTDSAESRPTPEPGLYFFPEDEVTETRARQLLAEGTPEERAWVISHLLRFAQWDDIWTWVDRDTVREVLPELDLPETLQAAWARMLKIEVGVT